jgi:methionine synthase II (cobalamin-independent)
MDIDLRPVKKLRESAAGAHFLQIDEPFLAGYPAHVELAVDAVNLYVPADRLMVNPDCGLRHLAPEVAIAKLRAMVAGAAMVRAELAGA